MFRTRLSQSSAFCFSAAAPWESPVSELLLAPEWWERGGRRRGRSSLCSVRHALIQDVLRLHANRHAHVLHLLEVAVALGPALEALAAVLADVLTDRVGRPICPRSRRDRHTRTSAEPHEDRASKGRALLKKRTPRGSKIRSSESYVRSSAFDESRARFSGGSTTGSGNGGCGKPSYPTSAHCSKQLTGANSGGADGRLSGSTTVDLFLEASHLFWDRFDCCEIPSFSVAVCFGSVDGPYCEAATLLCGACASGKTTTEPSGLPLAFWAKQNPRAVPEVAP